MSILFSVVVAHDNWEAVNYLSFYWELCLKGKQENRFICFVSWKLANIISLRFFLFLGHVMNENSRK